MTHSTGEPAPAAEADLGSVTDEEWLEGHAALTELVRDDPEFPDYELDFIWDPDLDPSTLIDDDEVDHAPGPIPSGLTTAYNNTGKPEPVLRSGDDA